MKKKSFNTFLLQRSALYLNQLEHSEKKKQLKTIKRTKAIVFRRTPSGNPLYNFISTRHVVRMRPLYRNVNTPGRYLNTRLGGCSATLMIIVTGHNITFRTRQSIMICTYVCEGAAESGGRASVPDIYFHLAASAKRIWTRAPHLYSSVWPLFESGFGDLLSSTEHIFFFQVFIENRVKIKIKKKNLIHINVILKIVLILSLS